MCHLFPFLVFTVLLNGWLMFSVHISPWIAWSLRSYRMYKLFFILPGNPKDDKWAYTQTWPPFSWQDFVQTAAEDWRVVEMKLELIGLNSASNKDYAEDRIYLFSIERIKMVGVHLKTLKPWHTLYTNKSAWRIEGFNTLMEMHDWTAY